MALLGGMDIRLIDQSQLSQDEHEWEQEGLVYPFWG